MLKLTLRAPNQESEISNGLPVPKSIVAAVLKKRAYFDTVELGLSRWLKRWEVDTLDSLCGSAIQLPTGADFLMTAPTGEKVVVPAKITLNQPTADAIKWLIGRLKATDTSAFIWRVDTALDLVTSTESEAYTVHEYLNAHAHKRGRGNAKTFRRIDEGQGLTTYIGPRGRPNQLCIYSGRPTKALARPCCHIEWRAVSSRSVRAIGINTLDDLLRFNHRAIWRKKLRLFELDMSAVGKRLRKKHLNTPCNIDESGHNRTAAFARLYLYLRSRSLTPVGSQTPLVTQLTILRQVKYLNRLLKRVDAGPLLPLAWGFTNSPPASPR